MPVSQEMVIMASTENNLGNESAILISEMLKVNTSLTSLGLQGSLKFMNDNEKSMMNDINRRWYWR